MTTQAMKTTGKAAVQDIKAPTDYTERLDAKAEAELDEAEAKIHSILKNIPQSTKDAIDARAERAYEAYKAVQTPCGCFHAGEGPRLTIDDYHEAASLVDAISDVLAVVDHDMLIDGTVNTLMVETRRRLEVMHEYTETLHDSSRQAPGGKG